MFEHFSNFLKFLWFKLLLNRKILLFKIYLCQKVDFEILVITSFCHGRAVYSMKVSFFTNRPYLKRDARCTSIITHWPVTGTTYAWQQSPILSGLFVVRYA